MQRIARVVVVSVFVAVILAVVSVATPRSAGRTGATATAVEVRGTAAPNPMVDLEAMAAEAAEWAWIEGVARAEAERAEAEAKAEAARAEAARVAAQRITAPVVVRSAVPVDGDWLDRLAQCECGGNPACNTGNGFYGTFQFMLSTWRSVGGEGLPSEASYEEQKYRAGLLLERSSAYSQFPGCTARLGPPPGS